MSISFVIFGIIGLLVLSVAVSGYVQKREQALLERRQKAAHYFYRAQSSQELLEQLRGVTINADIFVFLLNLEIADLKLSKAAWSKQPGIDDAIRTAITRQQGFKPYPGRKIHLPRDEQTLVILIASIKKLLSYLSNLQKSALLTNVLFEKWNAEVWHQLVRLEIEGSLRLAEKAVEENQAGTARNFFSYVEERLHSYPLEAAYKQEHQAFMEALKSQLSKRIDAEVDEVHEPSRMDAEKGIPLGDSDELFGEKKKW